MKERPILFSAPMIRAILEGRKTQTRRIIKLPYIRAGLGNFDGQATNIIPHPNGTCHAENEFGGTKFLRCPYGYPGDQLWVREAFADLNDRYPNMAPQFVYQACPEIGDPEPLTWRPSIHMPRAASRILLEVQDMRIERLQEISEEDAKSEGIEQNSLAPLFWKHYGKNDWTLTEARESFWSLWQSIHGPESWDENPWVWVITFKKI